MKIGEHLRQYGHVRAKNGGCVGVARAAARYYLPNPAARLTVFGRRTGHSSVVLSQKEARRVAAALLRFVNKPGKATCGGI